MTTSADKLWQIMPSMESMQRAADLADARPPAFERTNRDEFGSFAAGRGEAEDEFGLPLGQVTGCDLSDAPTPRFRCTDPDFAPDLIFEGALFASARLREALALDAEAVQWLDVDCADCPPAMRTADYRLMNLLAFANPTDRDRTAPALFDDVTLPDGTSTFVWAAPPYQPGSPVPRIRWRPDFRAPAPLFRVPGSAWTLAVDGLADRVMRAGLGDVVFMDVENDGTRVEGSDIIYRTR